jgi:hypothetical protein
MHASEILERDLRDNTLKTQTLRLEVWLKKNTCCLASTKPRVQTLILPKNFKKLKAEEKPNPKS